MIIFLVKKTLATSHSTEFEFWLKTDGPLYSIVFYKYILVYNLYQDDFHIMIQDYKLPFPNFKFR